MAEETETALKFNTAYHTGIHTINVRRGGAKRRPVYRNMTECAGSEMNAQQTPTVGRFSIWQANLAGPCWQVTVCAKIIMSQKYLPCFVVSDKHAVSQRTRRHGLHVRSGAAHEITK